MDPVTVSIVVGAPREQVFDYLLDIANHPEFTDHYIKDFRLTRENSVGLGAGARFRVAAPLQRFSWYGVSFVDVQAPRLIVEAGRGGKFNRIRILTSYSLEPSGANGTQVVLTSETQPEKLSDRLLESLGARRWLRGRNRRALRRLRAIIEDGEQRGSRATVAGS